ncbi:MAG: hypothetical protein WB772_17005 [Xanthobacteraceae bacterium]
MISLSRGFPVNGGEAPVSRIDYSLLAILTSDRTAWPQAGRNGRDTVGIDSVEKISLRAVGLAGELAGEPCALQSELAAVICIEIAHR